jgi:hypothetical protein
MPSPVVAASKLRQVEMIEKAWRDEAFKQELLANSKPVISRELGEPIPDFIHLKALAETPSLLLVIVPPKQQTPEGDQNEALKPQELSTSQERANAVSAVIREGQLGLAQVLRAVIQNDLIKRAWADDGFMQELLSNTRVTVEKVIAEKGLPVTLPASLEIKALEETATRRYMVIPNNPENSTEFEKAVLAGGATRITPASTLPGNAHDSKWTIANSNAWGYSLDRHGITLPLCGAFAQIFAISGEMDLTQNLPVCTFSTPDGTDEVKVGLPNI